MRELGRILRLMGGHAPLLWTGAGLALVTALAGIGLLTGAGWAVGSALAAGGAALPLLLLRFAAATRIGGRYAERLVTHQATFRALADIRVWLFRRLARLAPAQVADLRGGDALARMTGDIDTLDTVYLRLLVPGAVATIVVLGSGALLAPVAPAAAAILIAAMTVAGLAVPLAVGRGAAPAAARETLGQRDLKIAAVDHLQAMRPLIAFGAEARLRQALLADADRLLAAQTDRARWRTVGAVAGGLATGAALWGVAAVALTAGPVPPAWSLITLLAVIALAETVAPLPVAVQAWGAVRTAAARLFELSDRPPAVTDPADAAPLPRDASLGFHAVAVRDADGRPILRDIDLSIPAGSRLAILGPSGAGKSTLAALCVAARRPDAGHVTLGGVPLDRLRQGDVRRAVLLVDQAPYLFAGTVRDNLILAAPNAPDAALLSALDRVALGDWTRALPDGLDTWIGERGLAMSGGQLRRLALARALLRAPQVLVLDEPTEGLDAATEAEILKTLDTVAATATVLVVTHRPAVAAWAGRTVSLSAGRLVDPDPQGAS